MYRKRVILLVIIALIMTGCTRIDGNIDNVVNVVMGREVESVNTVSTGYELYVPIGVSQLEDNDYNQKFKVRDTDVYLYVDTVSYYYKNSLNYSALNKDSYYYKDINLNGKTGYVLINQDGDNYYVEVVYNYSKVEFYTNIDDLPVVLSNSLIILNSIRYNDNLIAMKLDSNVNDGRWVKYELDKPSDSESTFSQVLQEYVEPEDDTVVLPDSE